MATVTVMTLQRLSLRTSRLIWSWTVIFSHLWLPINNIVVSTILSLLAVTRTTSRILKQVNDEVIPVWRQSRPFSWTSPILSAASL